eukprot:6195154-Pleurochrysis_carterae.AAC.1
MHDCGSMGMMVLISAVTKLKDKNRAAYLPYTRLLQRAGARKHARMNDAIPEQIQGLERSARACMRFARAGVRAASHQI